MLKISGWMVAGLMMVAGVSGAQTTTPKVPAAAPLQMESLDAASKADPFPAVNPKFFTAATPTVDTVNSFLKTLWGFDPNRMWRVEAIQATQAPNVSKVVVFVAERGTTAKVQNTAFFVLPDGAHALAGDTVVAFGPTPFAATRKMLQERADGPTRGAASKDFMLVEFADLQCPHCKEAQGTMEQLVKDFPNARVVYQSYPLVDIHPFAFKAAAYGVCVAKQKNDAYPAYASAVYDSQAALTPETGDQTLKDAVTKAGLDAAAVDACASTQATKDTVNASIKLAQDVGVDQTPTLAVNGRVLAISQIPYDTLKSLVAFQASLDGVTGATGPGASTFKVPTLSK